MRYLPDIEEWVDEIEDDVLNLPKADTRLEPLGRPRFDPPLPGFRDLIEVALYNPHPGNSIPNYSIIKKFIFYMIMRNLLLVADVSPSISKKSLSVTSSDGVNWISGECSVFLGLLGVLS